MKSARRMNVVAVLRSQEVGAALHAAVEGMNGTTVDVHVGRLKDVSPEVDFLKSPDILLLDVDPREAEQVEELEKIVRTRFPATPVVVTAPEATLQDVRRLMRLGIADFLPQPFVRADLETALEFADQRRRISEVPTEAKAGSVVSFLKACGGVGATALAVQTALMLAQRSKKAGKSVALLDLDLQFGDVATYLDLGASTSVTELFEAPDRLDSEFLHSVMAHHESGLEVLTAPREMVTLDTMNTDLVERVLKLARAEFADVLIDLPTAWTDWSVQVLHDSDLVLLVTQLTVAGIRQAKRQLEILSSNGLGETPVKLVLNRYEKSWGRSVNIKEAERALGHKFDHMILNDFKTVSEALDQGVSISRIKKRSKMEQSVARMVEDSIVPLGGEQLQSGPRLSILPHRS